MRRVGLFLLIGLLLVGLYQHTFGALPGQVQSARMSNSTLGSQIDDKHNELEQIIIDFFGIPNSTNLTAAAFSITAGGVVTVSQAGFTGTTGTFSTSWTTPIVYGGTAAGSDLSLIATSHGTPSGAAVTLRGTTISYETGDSTASATYSSSSTITNMSYVSRDLGNNVAGPAVGVGRNTNVAVGTVGPSAGTFQFIQSDGDGSYTWVDAAGKLRIHTAAPTGNTGAPTVSDTAGTVIGDQTSWFEHKVPLGVNSRLYRALDVEQKREVWAKANKASRGDALARVLDAGVYPFRWLEESYKHPDGDSPVFSGLVGFDRKNWFLKNTGQQQVPSLNEVDLFGNLVLAIQALEERVRVLENE